MLILILSHLLSQYYETQIQQVDRVQRTAARCTCRMWRNISSVGEMLDVLQFPTLEAWRDQSSLLFFQRFIVGLCLFIKTSTWPCLREQDLPGYHTTHNIAGSRLIMVYDNGFLFNYTMVGQASDSMTALA